MDNPCEASSLSFWKTNETRIPNNLKVVADCEFSTSLLDTYNDEPYFKFIHKLEHIENCKLKYPYEFRKSTLEEHINHINSCYEDKSATAQELEAQKKRPVFDETLWICIYDIENNKIAASDIAEYDSEVKEGSLDWIQVSADYRGLGLRQEIVNELLRRLKDKADFVTVSGRVNNITKPEHLYEKCGFVSKAVWHILTEKELPAAT